MTFASSSDVYFCFCHITDSRITPCQLGKMKVASVVVPSGSVRDAFYCNYSLHMLLHSVSFFRGNITFWFQVDVAGTHIPKRVIADAEFKAKGSSRLLALAQNMWLHLKHVTNEVGKLKKKKMND